MVLTADTPSGVDLDTGTPWRVRVYDHGREGHSEDLIFDGEATFTCTPLPKVARFGDRFEVRASCGGYSFIVAEKGPSEYRNGGDCISIGERYMIALIDRRDPEAEADRMRAALEMSIDAFEVAHGVGVTFETDPS